MAIVASDILYLLSGGGTNTDPNLSLGGAISTTAIVDATLHNLFDKISGDESAAGDVEYRCFYLKNNHATLTWQAVKIWIDTQTPATGTTAEIGLGAAALSATETAVANEGTAPAGVTFSAADSTAPLVIGDIGPGAYKAVWLKRVVSAGAAAYAGDSVVIKAAGDTAA